MTENSDKLDEWLRDMITKLDEKVEKGFDEANKHLKELNGSVKRNQIEITKQQLWEKYHDKAHINSSKAKRFWVKTLLGGGGVAGIIYTLFIIILPFLA